MKEEKGRKENTLDKGSNIEFIKTPKFRLLKTLYVTVTSESSTACLIPCQTVLQNCFFIKGFGNIAFKNTESEKSRVFFIFIFDPPLSFK